MPIKTGPLTQDDLAQLWKSVVDPGYSRPFVEQGEGHGYEAFTQGFAQMGRVSQAVDRSFSALFVEPFSGQTNPPASGARRSTVILTFSRASAFAEPVVVDAGVVLVEEQATDFGPSGGEPVLTGRRYRLLSPAVFIPGDPGPLHAPAEAEDYGFGYSNPLPGTLTYLVQPGKDFTNDRGTVHPGVVAHRLLVRPDPDVVIPEHVGQYVELLSGANAGQRRRVVGYEAPTVDTTPPTGGTVLLAPTTVLRFSLVAGTFTPGEVLEQASTGAQLRVLAQAGGVGGLLVADRIAGTVALGTLCYGVLSGAVCVFDFVELSPDMTAELLTASWRILDWGVDFGLSVTNALSPAGGASAILDEIGDERGVQRRAGEAGDAGDDTYRERVSALADVVSPNALSRTANRILAPYGEAALLREVSYPLFRGFFFDGDATSSDPEIAFAYDFDALDVAGSGSSGNFIEGERVTQTKTDGTIASGRACLVYPVPAGLLPQPEPAPYLGSVAGIFGTFVNGPDIVGETSGAVVNGTVFTGGLVSRDRWKVLLDYVEFRAFFLMGVPSIGLGDFGFAYDAGAFDAYDSAPYLTFYDGYALTEASIDRGIWNALWAARAGGVGFDVVRET